MKVLHKTLLSQVAGGKSELNLAGGSVVVDGGGGADYGSEGGADYGWNEGGDYGWDGGDHGGSAAAISAPAFDGNGVGATSCVPMPPPPPPLSTGLFGYSLNETIAAGTAAGGLAYGIGQGIGASLAIESAGGLSGVGALGAGALGVGSGLVLGVTAAATTGGLVGTLLYDNSETVRNLSQAAVGGVFEIIEGVKQIGATALGIERVPQPVYHP